MAEKTIVTIDQVASFGDLVPPGHELIVRCIDAQKKESKPKEGSNAVPKPYLSFVFRILNGDYEGLEVTKTYWLSYKVTKGKLYIRGISELFDDLKAIGKPLPANTPIELGSQDKDGRGFVTNGVELLKLAGQRFHPEATPRIKVKSIAVPQQEYNPDTGKWEDTYNEDGSKKTRTEYMIVGVPGGASGTPPSGPSIATAAPTPDDASGPLSFA